MMCNLFVHNGSIGSLSLGKRSSSWRKEPKCVIFSFGHEEEEEEGSTAWKEFAESEEMCFYVSPFLHNKIIYMVYQS